MCVLDQAHSNPKWDWVDRGKDRLRKGFTVNSNTVVLGTWKINKMRLMLFFLLLMLLFRSVCHQVSNQADKHWLIIKKLPEDLIYLLENEVSQDGWKWEQNHTAQSFTKSIKNILKTINLTENTDIRKAMAIHWREASDRQEYWPWSYTGQRPWSPSLSTNFPQRHSVVSKILAPVHRAIAIWSSSGFSRFPTLAIGKASDQAAVWLFCAVSISLQLRHNYYKFHNQPSLVSLKLKVQTG